jgi:excisionase family DNA binding protein
VLLAGLDAELSAHVAAALLRYQRWLDDVGSPKPDGFEDLLGSTIAVVRGGQSHPVDAATRQRVRVGHFLTTADAATVLGCSQRTVRRRVADRTLQAHRIGRLVRFDPHDLLALGTAA